MVKKMSKARILALTVSVILHGVLFYYLGSMALDYALPEGQVTSYEMDFSKGHQLETTEVDVIETKEPVAKPISKKAPKVEAPEPKLEPLEPVAKAAPSKPAPTALPKKEVVEEDIVDHQGTMPVATEVPEDLQKDLVNEEDSNSQEEANESIAKDEAPEELPTIEEAPPTSAPAPTVTTAAAAATTTQTTSGTPGAVTNQPFGTPTGIQSDTVLIPYGSNRPISYPTMARLRKIEGICIVHYTVSAEGNVTNIKIAQSSGHSMLDSAAISAIKYWKFKPTGREGVYERPVRFQLTGSPKEAPAKLRRAN